MNTTAEIRHGERPDALRTLIKVVGEDLYLKVCCSQSQRNTCASSHVVIVLRMKKHWGLPRHIEVREINRATVACIGFG